MSTSTDRALDAAQLARTLREPILPHAGNVVAQGTALRRTVVIRYAYKLAARKIAHQTSASTIESWPAVASSKLLSNIGGPMGGEQRETVAGARAASDLILRVHKLLVLGQSDAALDLVFDEVDELLLARRFDDVAVMLQAATQNELPLNVLVGFLTITLPWKNHLPDARSELATRVRQKAFEVGGLDKARAVLRGLI